MRLSLLLALTTATSAFAQRSMGYWFAAPGALTAGGRTPFTLHLGGGGEFAIGKGISGGIEGGAIGLVHHYKDTVQGTASANAYYHFFHSSDARLDPFVTGGYSIFFRRGTQSLGNFGGGLNYWIWKTVAVRVEVRDHVMGTPRAHYWGIRLGMSFTELWP
ncbi:MAG: hypothetical protein ACM336_00935 [Acidobacteriota bacterium]